jgi:hypothetical protein
MTTTRIDLPGLKLAILSKRIGYVVIKEFKKKILSSCCMTKQDNENFISYHINR